MPRLRPALALRLRLAFAPALTFRASRAASSVELRNPLIPSILRHGCVASPINAASASARMRECQDPRLWRQDVLDNIAPAQSEEGARLVFHTGGRELQVLDWMGRTSVEHRQDASSTAEPVASLAAWRTSGLARCPERSTMRAVAAPQKPRPSLEELWAQLEALPVSVKGEILDGELYVHPRPRHARAIGYLGHHLGGAFDYDEGGPGGWWIVPEPGIELPNSPEVSPDLAGWRRSRMPGLPPDGEPFRSAPDWVCEVLSPSNARYDRAIKQPFYARMGVSWLWLVDPRDQTLQVSELLDAHWVIRVVCSNEEAVRLPPFEAIELPLRRLWAVTNV